MKLHIYAVRPGDSLYSIARKFGVSPDLIAKSNGLTNGILEAGYILKIPVYVVYHRVLSGQTIRSIADSLQIKPGDIIYSNPEAVEKLSSGDVLKILFPVTNK